MPAPPLLPPYEEPQMAFLVDSHGELLQALGIFPLESSQRQGQYPLSPPQGGHQSNGTLKPERAWEPSVY